MATRGPSELGGWSGVASIQRKLERSVTITMNREAIAYQMLAMASAQITDILSWDEDGDVKVKPASRIPDHALLAIKNIKVTKKKNGEQTLEVELYDKVAVLRILAKASGLLDAPEGDGDKPSVIDVNVVAPRGEVE